MASHSYTGAIIEHRRFDGAAVCSVLHPPGQRIDAHAHDWPVLALYRIGAYREESDEGGDILLDGPSVVFHPAGAAHADRIGATGLETLALTFDPHWLDYEARAALPKRSQWLIGGAMVAAAKNLARVCLAPAADDAALRRAASGFVRLAFASEVEAPVRTPVWAGQLDAALDRSPTATKTLARELARHPAWVARAYRAWRGEGLGDTARRRRVERAVLLLREGATSLAEVAAGCGFCDQSHMNRAFRIVLGRTPAQVRGEAALLAAL